MLMVTWRTLDKLKTQLEEGVERMWLVLRAEGETTALDLGIWCIYIYFFLNMALVRVNTRISVKANDC